MDNGFLMKFFFNSLLCLLLITGCSQKDTASESQNKQTQKFAVKGESHNLNLEKCKIHWLGKKVTGQHSGEILLKSGTVQIYEDKVVSGSFIIDMTTISNSDIESPEYKNKLEKHLRSDDFFSVEQHGEAFFLLTEVVYTSVNEFTFKGDLTIKGFTHPVSFPGAIIKNKDGTYLANAYCEIDRTLWDIRYGSGKFFENLGDKMIFDNFEISLELYTL